MIRAFDRTWRPFLLGALVALTLMGCTRRGYRTRADREAEELVREKSTSPVWALCNLNVYGDPRSRFFDPYDPDHPPMPADDPQSARIMRCIYGPHAMKRWHRDGCTDEMANPMWGAFLPEYTEMTDDGRVLLDLRTANHLARLHSRDYQQNLEEVYLSALDVAFERFRFQVQYFGGTDARQLSNGNEATAVLGRTSQGATRASQSITDVESVFGFTRRFAAGGEMIASIANSMVWQFSGEDINFTTSVINFGFVQPLLRNGGRIFVLERLTRAERTLLSNLRSMAQYEQGFYRSVAIGTDPDVEPRRIGGFTGGAGLTGFSGVGAGGFGGVGAGQGFGGVNGGGSGVGASGAGGNAGLAGGGEGILDGFYGLVQRKQTIRNTEVSLASQELTLGLLEANFDAGLIDLVQVDEFRQNIETERANLLRARVAFQDNLEGFLVGILNLPPTLQAELDDSIAQPFQLIDDQVIGVQQYAAKAIESIGDLPEEPAAESLREIAHRLASLAERTKSAFADVNGEVQTFVAERESRLASESEARRRSELSEAIDSISRNIGTLEGRIGKIVDEAKPFQDASDENSEVPTVEALVEWTAEVAGALQELGLLQARMRVEKIGIQPVKLDYSDALAIARTHRLDWMNQRAALVDQWRLVAFNANQLLAGVDITIDGDMGTIGDSATNFRGSTHNLRVGVAFDAPLNRKAERNVYRQSLIDFQRAKRRYVSYVDRVSLSLRSRLRQLERLEENLEIQRRALAIAIRRVDRTLEDLNQPFPPPAPGAAPAQLSPVLAQNLLRALSDLRNTQDNFLSVWLNHEAARINLLYQLGTMQVGPDGINMEVPLDAAIHLCALESKETDAVREYLDDLDAVTRDGGDIEHALLRSPDEELLRQVETTVGESIREADTLARTGHASVAEEETKPHSMRRGTLDALAEKLGIRRTPEGSPIPVEDYPTSLCEFKRMVDEGLSRKEIADRTGWDLAAVYAFSDAARLARDPIVAAVPVRELRTPGKPRKEDIILTSGENRSDEPLRIPSVPRLPEVGWKSSKAQCDPAGEVKLQITVEE